MPGEDSNIRFKYLKIKEIFLISYQKYTYLPVYAKAMDSLVRCQHWIIAPGKSGLLDELMATRSRELGARIGQVASFARHLRLITR